MTKAEITRDKTSVAILGGGAGGYPRDPACTGRPAAGQRTEQAWRSCAMTTKADDEQYFFFVFVPRWHS